MQFGMMYNLLWLHSAHPSCKGFITHGGLLSIQEGVFHGIPLIVLPIFGDQDRNAARIVNTGCGVMLEITKLTEEDLTGAIKSILQDER